MNSTIEIYLNQFNDETFLNGGGIELLLLF